MLLCFLHEGEGKSDVRRVSSVSVTNPCQMHLFKDNAHNLNSPMEFNKNGYTCCLDTTKHDEIEKSRGHHARYVTTAHYIITRFYSLFL